MDLLIFTTTAFWPFSLALLVLLGLIILEVLGLLLAASPSHSIDHFLPNAPDGALEWLHVGKVPALVLILLLLLGFSTTGFATQTLSLTLLKQPLTLWLAVPLALVGGVLWVRFFGVMIGRYIPHTQTSAISDLALLGHIATISGGTARLGYAAQARVRDQHGRLHYIQVEPEQGELPLGSEVILTDKIGARYRAHLLLPPPDHSTDRNFSR